MRHVGSSSLTRDQTQAHCTGSLESQPQDYQEVPTASTFDLLWWSAVKKNIDQHIVENMLKIEMQENAGKRQTGATFWLLSL